VGTFTCWSQSINLPNGSKTHQLPLKIPRQQWISSSKLYFALECHIALIRCKRIYNFWCSMLVLHQLLCFVYTSWHFYAFSRTNLLRRCHSASSYFLLFFYSRILPKEIFSELDETKAEVPIFLTQRWSPKGRQRRAERRPHHRVARAHLWPHHHMVWAPRVPSDIALPPINFPRRENPKGVGLHPWKVRHHRHHRRPISGDRSLCSGTLPGRGIAPGAISMDSTTIFIAVADSHDEEGVVLPRGWGLYR
jgi:hypothetical protein